MLVQACLNPGKVCKGCFNRLAGAMKHVQASLSARNYRQSSFHHCGGLVSHMLACVNAEKVSKAGFNRRGSAMHHVQACLSARKDQESSFHYYGSTVEFRQPCLCAGRT